MTKRIRQHFQNSNKQQIVLMFLFVLCFKLLFDDVKLDRAAEVKNELEKFCEKFGPEKKVCLDSYKNFEPEGNIGPSNCKCKKSACQQACDFIAMLYKEEPWGIDRK